MSHIVPPSPSLSSSAADDVVSLTMLSSTKKGHAPPDRCQCHHFHGIWPATTTVYDPVSHQPEGGRRPVYEKPARKDHTRSCRRLWPRRLSKDKAWLQPQPRRTRTGQAPARRLPARPEHRSRADPDSSNGSVDHGGRRVLCDRRARRAHGCRARRGPLGGGGRSDRGWTWLLIARA